METSLIGLSRGEITDKAKSKVPPIAIMISFEESKTTLND